MDVHRSGSGVLVSSSGRSQCGASGSSILQAEDPMETEDITAQDVVTTHNSIMQRLGDEDDIQVL